MSVSAQELSQMTVELLLQRWPETVAVFQKHQMACAGCAVAPFYTVSDAAEVYGLQPPALVRELLEAISGGQTADNGSALVQ